MQLPLDVGDKKCLCAATPVQTCSTCIWFVIVMCFCLWVSHWFVPWWFARFELVQCWKQMTQKTYHMYFNLDGIWSNLFNSVGLPFKHGNLPANLAPRPHREARPITRTESIRSMCRQIHSRFTPDSFVYWNSFCSHSLQTSDSLQVFLERSLFRLTSDSCCYTDLQSCHNLCFTNINRWHFGPNIWSSNISIQIKKNIKK